MQTSQETTNILKAMIEVAPELSSVPKSKDAGIGKFAYKYATLDSVIDMLRKVLPKHGLWFTQMPTRVGDKSTLTTRVFHSSGEWFEDSIEMTDTELVGTVTDTQKVGASITYFRRYALSAIFGIATEEDVDGNMQQAQVVKAQAKKPTAIEIIGADYKRRESAGQTKEQILKAYADILKTDDVRAVRDMSEKEREYVAAKLMNKEK